MVLVGVSMCPGDLTSASILAAITRPPKYPHYIKNTLTICSNCLYHLTEL